jgi:hypothetical protein
MSMTGTSASQDGPVAHLRSVGEIVPASHRLQSSHRRTP